MKKDLQTSIFSLVTGRTGSAVLPKGVNVGISYQPLTIVNFFWRLNMNKFLKFFALTGSCLASFSVMAETETCQSTPDCPSIGFTYTAEDCAGLEKLKCPFDDYYFCSKAPQVTCNEAAGQYVSCPVGAYCPEGLKVDGCYTPEECYKALGYSETHDEGKECTTNTFKSYKKGPNETVTCYSACDCPSTYPFGSEQACYYAEASSTHKLRYCSSNGTCWKVNPGICASSSCKYTSAVTDDVACSTVNTCSGVKYYGGEGDYRIGRIFSGSTCFYQKRKGTGYTSDDSRCINKKGNYITNSLQYYSSCSCDSSNGYVHVGTGVYCKCIKQGTLQIKIVGTRFSASGSYVYRYKVYAKAPESVQVTGTVNVSILSYSGGCSGTQHNNSQTYNISGYTGVNTYAELTGGYVSALDSRYAITSATFTYTNSNTNATYTIEMKNIGTAKCNQGTSYNSVTEESNGVTVQTGKPTDTTMDL